MDLKKRACPECDSDKYLFRGRKKSPAAAGREEATVTKYRCAACEHVWTELDPVRAEK